MNNLLESVLIARIKSFLWRAAGVTAIGLLTWSIQEIGLLELSPHIEQLVTVTLGLVLGEVTKFFNSNVPWMKSQQP